MGQPNPGRGPKRRVSPTQVLGLGEKGQSNPGSGPRRGLSVTQVLGPGQGSAQPSYWAQERGQPKLGNGPGGGGVTPTQVLGPGEGSAQLR